MATQAPVVTPEIDSAMQGAEASLAAGLRALSTGSTPAAVPASAPAPAPTPAEPAAAPAAQAPTPTAAAPASPTPATPPAAGAPSPEAPLDIASLFQSPEAKYFLSLHKGNVEAALAAAAGYNNRLAALAKKYPSEFSPGGVADPKAPVPAPAVAAPVSTPASTPASPAPAPGTTPPVGSAAAAGAVPAPAPTPAAALAPAVPATPAPGLAVPPEQLVDWSKVHADTLAAVDQDAQCVSYVRTWVESDEGIRQLTANITKSEQEMAYIQRQLTDQRLGLTEQDRGEREDQLRALRQELALAKIERTNLQTQARQVEAAFNSRHKLIYDHVASQHYGQAQEQVFREEDKATEAQATRELLDAWAPAVARVATTHSIPVDMTDDFREEAKMALQARWAADPNFVVDVANIDAFLAPIAASFMSRMDRYHRAQSTMYAALAAQRAAAPSPTPPAASVSAPTPPSAGPVDLEALMEERSREVAQRMLRR